MEQRLLAIWKYDDAVGYLCGEVEEFTDSGCVKVKEYPNYTFKPLKILPYDEKYKIKLDELKEEHRERQEILKKKYRQEFEEFCGGINRDA